MSIGRAGDADPLGNLPLFAGLDAATLAQLGEHVEDVELEAGCYLSSTKVTRPIRLRDPHRSRAGAAGQHQFSKNWVAGGSRGAWPRWTRPGPRTVRALRDTKLVRLTKAQFDEIADHGALAAPVLCRRGCGRHRHRRPDLTSPEVVVSVIGVSGDAPARQWPLACLPRCRRGCVPLTPGRVDRDGLDRAERVADKVVLHAAVDAGWRDFCPRVAD
ncbi:hypothetical protein ABLN97_01130 [Mycobacterium tuberculosis]